MDFSASLDPGSLDAITQMLGFQALLDPAIQDALSKAGNLVVTTAQTNTWTVFANPTGNLAASIYFWVASPTEVDVAVGVPYGRRRELGFSGRTDSLGRYYAFDPGKPYLEPAMQEDTDMILMYVAQGVEQAMSAIGGGASGSE